MIDEVSGSQPNSSVLVRWMYIFSLSHKGRRGPTEHLLIVSAGSCADHQEVQLDRLAEIMGGRRLERSEALVKANVGVELTETPCQLCAVHVNLLRLS